MAVAGPTLGLSFEVRWKPFFLDGSLPGGEGKDKAAHYQMKFGAARVAQMQPTMQRTFADAGLPTYNLGGRVGNTLDSHRLMELALQQGGPALQDALVERMFDDYFIKGLALSDKSVLLSAAAAAKVDGAEALLKGDDLTEDVFALVRARKAHTSARAVPHPRPVLFSQVEDAYGAGVSGVPHFVIGGKAHVSGGQEAKVFLDIFREIAASPQ